MSSESLPAVTLRDWDGVRVTVLRKPGRGYRWYCYTDDDWWCSDRYYTNHGDAYKDAIKSTRRGASIHTQRGEYDEN